MKRTVTAILVILTVALGSLSGCKGSDTEKQPAPAPRPAQSAADPATAVHNQIVRYNQLLSEGYKKGDVTRLQEVADPDQAQKVYYHMAALGEGKTRMVSELKKIDFVETDLSAPSKARVATREVWDFAFVDFQTGKMKSAVKDYLYQVQYQLENRGGNWMITAINATGEDRKEVPSWNQILNKR